MVSIFLPAEFVVDIVQSCIHIRTTHEWHTEGVSLFFSVNAETQARQIAAMRHALDMMESEMAVPADSIKEAVSVM